MAKHPFLQRCYELTNNADVQSFYDEIATGYDATLENEIAYIGPQLTVMQLRQFFQPRDQPIIDLGCGTGLVGRYLQAEGYNCVDGIDYSTGMLAIAGRKNYYRQLTQADLNQPLAIADNSYAAAIAVGAFGIGHIEANAIDEVIRIVQPGGIICLSINERALHKKGFAAKFIALQQQKKVKQLLACEEDYHLREGIKAWIYVLSVR